MFLLTQVVVAVATAVMQIPQMLSNVLARLHTVVVYLLFLLWLYLSAQFMMWGWVG